MREGKFTESKDLTYALRTEIDNLKGFPKSFRWFLTNIIYDVECHIRGDFPITSEDGYVFSFVNSNYRKVLRDKNLWKDPMKKTKKKELENESGGIKVQGVKG